MMRGRPIHQNQIADDPWWRLWLAVVERARKDAFGIGLTHEGHPDAVQEEARAWLDELKKEMGVL